MSDACTANIRKSVAKLLDGEFNLAIERFVEMLVAKKNYSSDGLI